MSTKIAKAIEVGKNDLTKVPQFSIENVKQTWELHLFSAIFLSEVRNSI